MRGNKRRDPRWMYKKRWYEANIKPFRKWKQPTLCHQCVFCGMITNKEKFEDPEAQFVIKSFKRWGNRFEIYVNEDDILNYMKLVGMRTLRFLQICVIKGLISKEEIARTFDLFTEQKAETITPVRVISEAETYSPINLSQRKIYSPNHTINSINTINSIEVVKPVKVITTARTK